MNGPHEPQYNPPVRPPSFSAGDCEMRDYYAAQDPPRTTPDQTPYLAPYLGLQARLSQVWINRWTVLILLVLVRTLFAIASLDNNLASARKQALSACTTVESVGSTLASMPHYMADGINQLTADGIDKAIDGLLDLLLLSVTGVEDMLLFIINLLTSTYVCLITFAVSGSLHIAIDVAEDVGSFLNATVQDVGKDLASAVADFDGLLNKFLAGVDDVGSFFKGKKLTPPTIDLSSSIAKLNSLQLPTGYDQGLDELNASLPTFAQVQNLTNLAISFPFEEVKKSLSDATGTYSTNLSLFPVPKQEHLTFCSDNQGIEDFFEELIHIERLARKIFLAVLIVLAALVCIPMAYREIRRWRFMKARAAIVRSDSLDTMDAVYLVSRPYTSSAGLQAAKLAKSDWHRNSIRWSVAYATTVPALFVLSLALAGLLGCLCQYILLKAIEKEVPDLENKVIGFSDKVVASLTHASVQWAVGTNEIINTTNAKINHDVFGWVNTSTSTVNNTLNVFVDEMMIGLNDTFGGTPLYEPVLEVLNCLVLLKVTGIEKALTWVSDHAHVTFPEIPVNTFSLGTLAKVSDASNGSILASGPGDTATKDISDAVNHVTNLIAKTIRQEAIISSCVLIVWLIIVLIGVVGAMFAMLRPSSSSTARSQPTLSDPSPDSEKDNPGDRFAWLRQSIHTSPASKDSTGANTYNGQPYTISRRPPPTLRHDSGINSEEKLGQVGSQNVESAIQEPHRIRESSCGSILGNKAGYLH